ncbi:MAG: hypothetical protein H6736_02985 [Alphaproteobacteria bacterium]|nr:hypothetical protein [Alphaproteobacteria bacterium]MCB9690759.1 hypothetical protein [Alphaproteobacteria bacterium]
MLDELLPMTLSQGAARVGVEPLEIVRLMVGSDLVSPDLTVSPAQLDKLAEAGGIESGWWEGVAIPADTVAGRGVVRAALGILAARAASGPVRMDNLWRGRPLDDQDLIEQAVETLDEAGTLQIVNAPAGVQVMVEADGIQQLQAIAAGTESGGLDEIFQD